VKIADYAGLAALKPSPSTMRRSRPQPPERSWSASTRLGFGRVPRGPGLMLRLAIGLRRPRVAAGRDFAELAQACAMAESRHTPGNMIARMLLSSA
jgi:hypothetical protein